MFGNKYLQTKSKGIIFIIDLILATAVVVAIILFITSIKPQSVVKQQYDLVYTEAESVLQNKNINLDYDSSKDYLCRSFNKVYFDSVSLKNSNYHICTNIIR